MKKQDSQDCKEPPAKEAHEKHEERPSLPARARHVPVEMQNHYGSRHVPAEYDESFRRKR